MAVPFTQSELSLFRLRNFLASSILRKTVAEVNPKALRTDAGVQAAVRRLREFVDQPENDVVAIAAPQLAYDMKMFVLSHRLFQNPHARLEFGSREVLQQQAADAAAAAATAANASGKGSPAPQKSGKSNSEDTGLVWDDANVPAADDPRLVVVNPIVRKAIGPIVSELEECISIPDFHGVVPRYSALDVEYLDAEGHKVQGRFHRAAARVFQHELDHLYGTVYADRVATPADFQPVKPPAAAAAPQKKPESPEASSRL